MPDPDTFLWGLIFGAIGCGYVLYGKNAGKFFIAMLGIALCLFPYFISDTIPMILVGTGLTLAPLFFKAR